MGNIITHHNEPPMNEEQWRMMQYELRDPKKFREVRGYVNDEMARIGLGSINQPPSSVIQPIRQDPFLDTPHNALLTAPNMATPILENTSMHGISFSPEFAYRVCT